MESLSTRTQQQYKNSPEPFYKQLKALIRGKIHSSEWPANFKIPSENQLVEQFGYSRMTINRALRELTNEGLLVRTQGVGTFVNDIRGESAMLEINNIADEIVRRGHKHSSRIISLTKIQADIEQAMIFHENKGVPLYHCIICHLENEIPVMLEDRYVNATLVPEFINQDFNQITPNGYLCSTLPSFEGEHIIEAENADLIECKYLEIEASTPCLILRRRTWLPKPKQEIVTSVRLIYPGNRYRLQGFLSNTSSS